MLKTIDIDSMKAGRELDARIATEVKGLNVKWEDVPASTRRVPLVYNNFKPTNDAGDSSEIVHILNLKQGVCPNFSTNIADAWPVGCQFTTFGILFDDATDTWIAKIDPQRSTFDDCRYTGIDESAPLAICRAALKAVIK